MHQAGLQAELSAEAAALSAASRVALSLLQAGHGKQLQAIMAVKHAVKGLDLLHETEQEPEHEHEQGQTVAI